MAGVVGLTAVAAAAAGVYGGWTLNGSIGNWTGTLSVPAAGFPSATYTLNSNTPQIGSGANTFLGPATPFGGVFGSSQNQGYLLVPLAPGSTASTLTITFASPTPASGWGFAIGDIDADTVTISAAGPSGALTTAQLGWQSGFNYCGVLPKPSACTKAPYTDIPTWNPATATMVGNVNDTDGAAGWFRPTASMTSLTFSFARQAGSPVYQLWFAAQTADITGKVQLESPGGPVPPPLGSTLRLERPDGSPVLDAGGNPITTSPGLDGSYAFPGVVATMYQVTVVPPPGFEVSGPASKPADATTGVCMVDFLLRVKPPVTTTTTTAPPPTTTLPPPPAPPTTVGPRLPETGSSTDLQLALAIALTGAGVALVCAARRVRPRHMAR